MNSHNKRWRLLQQRRRLKNLERQTNNSCFHGAYYDEERGRIIKFSYSCAKKVRKRFTRKIRRKINNGIDISNGRLFKRIVYSYKYEII